MFRDLCESATSEDPVVTKTTYSYVMTVIRLDSYVMMVILNSVLL